MMNAYCYDFESSNIETSGNVGGEFFDHVLPVEMETPRGLRSLNLGYNNGENPFVAAQRFINQNELGQNYLQEIADWIIAR
jgi:phospholipase A-2-activating protein